MRISDWSSDVCSSDLFGPVVGVLETSAQITHYRIETLIGRRVVGALNLGEKRIAGFKSQFLVLGALAPDGQVHLLAADRSEEHTSELQSLMRISYAVFCFTKKNK